ncbi:MAG: mechanosensitive ion channel family protein [Bacteroidales bacterium]|nr:mechanosensitive ion channel family protein [Bacteroidales bacterium]
MMTSFFSGLPGLSAHLIHYVLAPLVVLILASLITKIFRSIMRRYFEKSATLLHVDLTRYRFFKNAVSFIIFLVAFIIIFYMIPELRSLGVTLFAGAGILAIIIGFASQAAISNIISGIFIVTSKPFRVGDYIKISNEHFGTVEDITLRHTVIRNNENRRIIIPNSVINNQTIINSNIVDEKVCSLIELGISFDSSIDRAIKIMQEEVLKHPFFLDNRTEEQLAANEPPVVVRVMGLGEYFVNLRAYAWAATSMNAFVLRTDLYKTIKERFDREGIEIPYPHRTLIKKDKPKA